MKNLYFLLCGFLFVSCANMETDADKVCQLLNETKHMLPKMMKVGMQSAFGNEAAEKELSELENRSAKMLNDIENISSKYNEQEFQNYLLNNCAVAEEFKEFGDAMEALESAIDDLQLE